MLGGCSEKKTASTADTSLAGETIYGEVSEVGDNSITIEVTEQFMFREQENIRSR